VKFFLSILVSAVAALGCQGQFLINPYFFASPPSVNDETAYWKLDESTGAAVRVDSGPNGQDLTPFITQASTNGIISNANNYPSGTSDYVSRVDSTTLSCGDIDFSLGAWIMLYDHTTRAIVCKGSLGSAAVREYDIISFSGTFYFSVSNGATVSNVAWSGGASSLNAWHYVVGWHDATANLIWIQVDNGTPVSAAHSGGCNDAAGAFIIGRAGDGFQFEGAVDEVGFWKRLLTSDERTFLYNGGAGETCCPFQ